LRGGQLAQHGAFARASPSGYEQRARITYIEAVVQLGQLSAPTGFHGGIAPGRVTALVRAGCRGVAVSSAICGAGDPAAVARAMVAELSQGAQA
jgi:thiamine monophosphate synthase